MVQITGFSVKENKEGKTFVSLELQGEISMTQSRETGKFYATARKCSITSTFSEEVAATLVGKELPGTIEKVACEEYELTDKETGEVKLMSHRYEYLPEAAANPLRIASSNRQPDNIKLMKRVVAIQPFFISLP